MSYVHLQLFVASYLLPYKQIENFIKFLELKHHKISSSWLIKILVVNAYGIKVLMFTGNKLLGFLNVYVTPDTISEMIIKIKTCYVKSNGRNNYYTKN